MPLTFPRGFKSWCENVALQQRRELGLYKTAPLDPRQLASHLGVTVWNVDEVPGLDPSYLKTLLVEDCDSWSAITICEGIQDLIILNSAHSGGRPASDLMHELSHLLLGHKAARVDITEDGSLMLNTFDRAQEEEANWLAGTLLLPREALVFICKSYPDLKRAAKEYGVSMEMLTYRLQVTAVQKQLQLAARYRHRT